MPDLRNIAAGFPRYGILLLLACLLAQLIGCGQGTSHRAPIVERTKGGVVSRSSQPVTKGHYVVQPGDTLYSISFRFGWDWKELARNNGIKAPYTIRPRQVIYFSKTQQTASKPKAQSTSPAKATTQAKAPATPPKQPAKQPVKQAPVATSSVKGWRWPASGAVINKYSSGAGLDKGIDIGGKLGQPIVATAKGTVVYAGSGLRGYGELVIIKHDDVFISAYGHNRRLLVNEGQQVNAGQQIAEMGSTGTDQVKLHFEIRRQGKPVDPLQYLPKR